MRVHIAALALAAAGLSAAAQEPATDLVKVSAEVRLDYQRDYLDGKTVKDNTGFEGKFLNLQLDGNITPELSYSWRQRLNKNHDDRTFFDATDWVYLTYGVDRWAFSAGKQVVSIGGWEYDRAPIDLYSCSVFWNNIPCYQLGASAAYSITPEHSLKFQVTQSPFFTKSNRDMYGYNLFWQGKAGIYSSLWSANLMEYAEGRYISYIALGNRFTVDRVSLELDVMNRASSHQAFLLKDCSVMGELKYRPSAHVALHAKATYDVNHSGTAADLTVLNGTELTMAGAGIEYYPLVKHNQSLRLHANCYYSWGKNTNTADVMQNKSLMVDVGIKWHMDIFSLKHK
ncbi:MAG: OprO/OprP family phosphate-selective porin [Muribaculaceae bacterium]|nr:OprO/OprP family phosphate-selective porin [Muribaculaceae bacterium]